MTRTQQYDRDTQIEKLAAEFLDANFYPMFDGKADVTRYTDTYHQFGGIDISINSTNFDEKCKVKGCLNKVLEFVGLECSLNNKADCIQDGWFMNKNLSTDYYAIIGLSATVNDDSQLTSVEQITTADVLWLKKQDIVDYVESYGGFYGNMTMAKLKEDAYELRRDGDNHMIDIFGQSILDNDGKARHHYPHRKYWLTYSTKMKEKPVNLVIPRKTLESLKNSRHFIVTKNNVKRG